MPVTINQASISKTDVAKAAKDAGLSARDLDKLVSTLTSLAENMSFKDGQALSSLATEINNAAAHLAVATDPPAAPAKTQDQDFGASFASTSRPGM